MAILFETWNIVY